VLPRVQDIDRKKKAPSGMRDLSMFVRGDLRKFGRSPNLSD
jgi:hypothetical protein